YAEYQKTDKDAKLNHYLAVQEMRSLWELLSDKQYTVEELAAIANRFSMYSQKAQESYLKLISKFPKSKATIRFFAKFCFDVSNDIERGNMLTERADDLELESSDVEEDEIQDIVGSTMGGFGKLASRNGSIRNTSLKPVTSSPNMNDSKLVFTANSVQDQTLSVLVPALPSTMNIDNTNNPSEFAELPSIKVPESVISKKSSIKSPRNLNRRDTNRTAIPIFTKEKNGNTRDAGSSHGTSVSSATGAEKRSKMLLQQARLLELRKRSSRIQMLIIFATLIAIAISVTNFVFSLKLLNDNADGLIQVIYYNRREYYTGLLFRRTRQLQEAEQDEVKVSEIQCQLFAEMQNYSTAVEALYTSREFSKLSDAFYNAPTLPVLKSYYPSLNGSHLVNVTFYEAVFNFVTAGLYIANISSVHLKEIDTNHENNFRWILDNFWGIQAAYDYNMDDIFKPESMNNITQSQQMLFILTGIYVFVIFVFAVILDFNVRNLLQNQHKSLEIFTKIPFSLIKETIIELDEADSSDIFTTAITKQGELISNNKKVSFSANLFRLQYLLYCISVCGLSGLFAYINVAAVQKIGLSSSMMHSSGDMLVFQTRLVDLARELVEIDSQTWPNATDLYGHYMDTFNNFIQTHESILYGDTTVAPPMPSYDEWPGNLYYLMNQSQCLLYNQTNCLDENRKWNNSIGYNPDTVSHGLLHLTMLMRHQHEQIAVHAAEAVPFVPDPNAIEFFEKVLEWDFLEGWLHVQGDAYTQTLQLVSDSITENITIFVIELILVFLGQYVVVSRMMSHFRFTDNSIFEMLNRLPDKIKNVPEVSQLLVQNGVIPKSRGEIVDAVENSPMLKLGGFGEKALKLLGKKLGPKSTKSELQQKAIGQRSPSFLSLFGRGSRASGKGVPSTDGLESGARKVCFIAASSSHSVVVDEDPTTIQVHNVKSDYVPQLSFPSP
ncbi:hypothetical protein HDU79_006326, partial [Rhizoclosmatium sp. JEL0117]